MMTDLEIAQSYADLLILQYLGKPRAYETVLSLVLPVIMNQLPTAVQNAYAIETAVGKQLDVIGKYVGVSRNGVGVGGQPINLNDSDYRQLIRIAIARNSGGSSLYDIQNFLNFYFFDQIFVFDYQNMRLSYYINTSVGSQNLVELLITEGLLPKPMAVQLSAVIYGADLKHFFGMRTYLVPAFNVTPFNTYTSVDPNSPWLSYVNSI